MKFNEIINGENPVLVDFFAEWCGPCKTMKPVLDQLKQRVGASVTVLKIDIDKNPAVAAHFQIQGVPTFMLFQKGKILWRQSGAMPLQQLEAAIANAQRQAT